MKYVAVVLLLAILFFPISSQYSSLPRRLAVVQQVDQDTLVDSIELACPKIVVGDQWMGTAYCVGWDGQYSYLLTARHVLFGGNFILSMDADYLAKGPETIVVGPIRIYLPIKEDDVINLGASVPANIVIISDSSLDVVLLKCKHKFPVIKLCDKIPHTGTPVFGFGYAKDGPLMMSNGIVGRSSSIARKTNIFSTTMTFPGDSGGPLVDADGQCVGLVQLVLFSGNFGQSHYNCCLSSVSIKKWLMEKADKSVWLTINNPPF